MGTWRGWILAALVALSAEAAAAQSPADAVIDQLRAQGYVEFTVTRTLLGRIRVVARGPEGRREIVFNPATGEILRDYTQSNGGRAAPRLMGRWDDAEDGGGNPGGRGRGGEDGDSSDSGGGSDDGDDDDGNPGRGGGNGNGQGNGGQGNGNGNGGPGNGNAGQGNNGNGNGNGGPSGGG